MAAIDEKKLQEDLRRKNKRALYFLVSEDPYKLDHYAQLMRESFLESAQATATVFYGDELDPDALLEAARTSSLWDPYRLIFVRQAERMPAKKWEKLSPLYEDPSDRSSVAFLLTKADARLKFMQGLSKASEQAVMVKMQELSRGEWNIWTEHFLRQYKKDLSQPARELLTYWTEGSLADLKSTLEKAALYADSAPEITPEHIAAVGFKVTQEDIFALTTALLSGDKKNSLLLLDKLLGQGEEPLAILGLLARQFRWLLAILAMRSEGAGDAVIAAECKIFPAAAKVLFPASQRLGGKGVVRALNLLTETELDLKLSRAPAKYVLSKLVTELA